MAEVGVEVIERPPRQIHPSRRYGLVLGAQRLEDAEQLAWPLWDFALQSNEIRLDCLVLRAVMAIEAVAAPDLVRRRRRAAPAPMQPLEETVNLPDVGGGRCLPSSQFADNRQPADIG